MMREGVREKIPGRCTESVNVPQLDLKVSNVCQPSDNPIKKPLHSMGSSGF